MSPTESARFVYPGLDTLRAVASVAVVATHACFWAGFYDQGLIGAAAQRLELGVAIFFVLSGFLLSQPYLVAAATGSEHDSAARYFWKRALRVLPIYWVAVAAALLVLPENEDLGVDRWVDNFLLIDVFRSDELPFGLTQMWSLSTEATFYLALPLFMWLLLRSMRAAGARRHAVTLLVLITVSVASIVWIALSSNDLAIGNSWLRRGLLSYVCWFAGGIALAYLDTQRRTGGQSASLRVVEKVGQLPGMCWLFAGSLFVVASTPLAGPIGFEPPSGGQAVIRHVLYAAIAVLIMIPSVFGDPSSTYGRVMAHPIGRHLGHISYGLFCCHVLILELEFAYFGWTEFDMNPWFVLITTLAISLAVSEVLYRLVEKPALRLKNLGRRTSKATSAQTAKVPSN